MRIEFIDIDSEDEECFHSIELECNPFKVREDITLSVNNHDKKIWDVAEINQKYTIIDISHYSNISYRVNMSSIFVTNITVKKQKN